MQFNDLVNGVFELLGAFVIFLNIRRLHKDKEVKGYDPKVTVFFTAWGLWNLWYYPSLDQWLSFWGGLAIVVMNSVWLCQIYYYNHKNDS
jgi:uncharacterized membrane protein YfcA